ncbi:Protein kri1 [Picochlorum sp. SENEW3]|nr:Protein kri1 [Picochlorum sp. SENEW3]
MAPKTLFDDNEEEGFDGGLKINTEFARRFEHNKKREELHRLKEKFPEQAARLEAKGVSALMNDEESSSSSEEEDDGVIPQKTEKQILETILKIRNKDTSIYDPNAKFYSEDEEEEVRDAKRKEKPVYLKDVVYKEAMELANGNGSDADEDEKDRGKSYVEAQEGLKRAFLTAYEEEVGDALQSEGDGFGGVLQKSETLRKEAEITDEETQKLVDKIFSKGDKEKSTMTENDRFLRDYILKQAWMRDSDDEDEHFMDDGVVDEEEDEQAMDAAEAFEASYNFRFEEPGGTEIVTHPREIEGIVRKKDDRRKQKRMEKAARKAQEEEERRRELKQLKNLKKMEIEDKLKEVKNIAGSGVAEEDLIGKLLDGEFDPEKHDQAMQEAFGEEYYNVEEEEDVEDEEFDKKLAAMAEYSSDEEVDNTISAMLERKKKKEDDDDPENTAKQDVKKLLDEYYKLDYEDHVGGIPTRFRYKEVEPETYGLTFEEILMMDDKELNQIMGLKRVAATYHDGPKRRPNYGRLNEWRKNADIKAHDRESKYRNKHKKIVEHRDDSVQKKEEKSLEEMEADRRKDTFKKPSLKKRRREGHQEDTYKKEKKVQQSQTPPNPALAGLTKAQRKNLKRSQKRQKRHSELAEQNES